MYLVYHFYGQTLIVLILETLAMFVLWTAAMLLLRGKARRIAALIGAVLAVVLVLMLTLIRRGFSPDLTPEFIPFSMFFKADQYPDFWRELYLNIMLFVPLGLSLPYVLSGKVKHNVLVTIAAGFGLSVFVEIVQLIYVIGKFEIDDMIMNLIGVSLGTLSFLLFSLIRRKCGKKE